MKIINMLPVVAMGLFLTSCSHKYYVVRHAEKEVAGAAMSSDVQLSDAGRMRAEALKDLLQNKNIKNIYSTRFVRTKETAEPLRAAGNGELIFYGPAPTGLFFDSLKQLKTNTLIVGHSNTVDDIVNGLTGEKSVASDLDESEYNNLFIVTYGSFPTKKIKFRRMKFGQ